MLTSARRGTQVVPTSPVFQAEHISLAYPTGRGKPEVPILTDISFEVQRGTSLTLVGPSGAGKSTLLRCLNRLAEPTQGRVRFNDRDIRSLDPLELRRRAALVLQTPVLFEGTVRDNLRMQPRTARADLSEAHLVHALAEVGLDAAFLDRDGMTLSGGEKQRVTIARALLGDPEALLLDEPTAALDPPNVAVLVKTISELRRSRRLTIVAVTHQPEMIRLLGGCLLYLVRGNLQAYECIDGSASTITDARLRAFLAGERVTVTS
jgi:ABC-type multidrug transport system fused ATPase/permease subunit